MANIYGPGKVVIELTRDEFEQLISVLGPAALNPSYREIAFRVVNALHRGYPGFVPYEVTDEPIDQDKLPYVVRYVRPK